MGLKICTACGYEGKPITRPGDFSDDDISLPGMVLSKLLTTVSMLVILVPLKFNWIAKIGKTKVKTCPNCGLPTMVSLNSDAGWLAKRKQEIKSGAVVLEDGKRKQEVVAFGKEIKLPGDEEKPTVVEAPRPEKLPSLDVLLEPEKNDSIPAVDAAEKHEETKPKKPPANPDEW